MKLTIQAVFQVRSGKGDRPGFEALKIERSEAIHAGCVRLPPNGSLRLAAGIRGEQISAIARSQLKHRSITDRHANRIRDRKSTRLNSSHLGISYAVFCLKKTAQ